MSSCLLTLAHTHFLLGPRFAFFLPYGTRYLVLYIYMYITSFVKPERPQAIANFRLSSRRQTGIRWPPVSGPRLSLLARSRPGSRSPASTGLIPARALSGSRAATEQSNPEPRSFHLICGDGDTCQLILFLHSWRFVLSRCFSCGDQGSIYRFDLSVSRSIAFSIETSLRGSPLAASTLSALPASVPVLPAACRTLVG